jgi:type IV fimbrial biogenesis protein FimT
MGQKFHAVKDKSGFTLVEMVVTLSIFSILAAIAIPAYTNWIPRYQLQLAARDLFSNMQLAKLDAIKRNGSCTVTTNSPGANEYTVGDKIVKFSDYDKSVKFGNAPAGSIKFDSRGMCNPFGSVRVTNTQNTATYEIEVEAVGTISMKKL